MKLSVKMPRVSDTIDDVVVVKFLVSLGDRVDVGTPLVTVDADKATVDIPAPVAGTVVDFLVDVDDEVTTGTRLIVLETSA